MKDMNNNSFIKNKERLAEIRQLGKQLENETDPERKAALKTEISQKGEVLTASLGADRLANDAPDHPNASAEAPQDGN